MDKNLETILIVGGVAAAGWFIYKHYTTPAPLVNNPPARNTQATAATAGGANGVIGAASGAVTGIDNLYGQVSSLFGGGN